MPTAPNDRAVRPTPPLSSMLLLYATRDGQSCRIARRIAERLAGDRLDAVSHDLAQDMPTVQELAAAPLIALVAAVRYGRHLPEAEQLLTAYRASAPQAPLVFVSVNLTARKPDRNSAATNRYLRKSIARHGLAPALATAIGGRLDYPHYAWLDRQIIRLIMQLTGGPTDPRTCTEFTDWQAVDAVAARIAGLLRRVVPPADRQGPLLQNAALPG